MPIWAIAGSAALLLWAGLYLGAYSGGFQGDVFNEAGQLQAHQPAGPVDPIVAEQDSAGTGFSLPIARNAIRPSGLGQAGQFPPLVGCEWVVGDAPKRLPQILLHGIQGTIHVKGAEYNNQMPAWAGVLTDKQIADVLTYVRSELGGNGAGPIHRSRTWTTPATLTIRHARLLDRGRTPADPARTARGRYAGRSRPVRLPARLPLPTAINPPGRSPGAVKPPTAPLGTDPLRRRPRRTLTEPAFSPVYCHVQFRCSAAGVQPGLRSAMTHDRRSVFPPVASSRRLLLLAFGALLAGPLPPRTPSCVTITCGGRPSASPRAGTRSTCFSWSSSG